MADLTADDIRNLPEYAVIILHDPYDGPIAHQRARRPYWRGVPDGYGMSTDEICYGIAQGDRWELAWAPGDKGR